MNLRAFSRLSNEDVLLRLNAAAVQECVRTAEIMALIAEVDERRLYAPEGQESMYAYCVNVLHMSEDVALKRIRVARAARKFPPIFDAVLEGRLHLSAVVELAPYLTADNADELLAAATHKTRAELLQLLAERFPRPDLPERIELGTPPAELALANGPQHPGNVQEWPKGLAPGPVAPPESRPKVTPLSAERVGWQLTVERSTDDKLRYAQALLGRQGPAGEMATVLDRALDAFIEQLEKQKFAATSRPRQAWTGSSANPRHIPAHVKKTVWQRDGGRCTFTSASGHRCQAIKGLEYDHIEPVACGGEATVENLRIRCRTHNQYEAECVFGAGFMHEKREAAKRAAASRQAEKARKTTPATTKDPAKDVIPWLRRLGVRAEECRRVAMLCEALPPETSLEQRVRHALREMMPAHRRVEARPATAA